MSLIGDALKRQQESQPVNTATPEQAAAAASAASSPPLTLRSKAAGSVPPTEDQTPHKEKPAKRRPVMELVLLGIGFILLIFAGAALYYWLTGGNTSSEPVAVAAPIEKPAAPAPVIATPPPERAPVEEQTAVPGQAEPAKPVEVSPAPVDAVVTGQEEPATEETVAAPSAAEPETVAEIVWPTMFIQGAMGSGNRGAVIVDGDVVAVGSEVYGVKIIEVTQDGVITEYQGERRSMPVRK